MKFIALPFRDQVLLLKAFSILLGVRVALRLVSLERIRAWAACTGSGGNSLERAVWATRATARRTPGASCLVSAIALQRLLSRGGHSSELHVGVARRHERFAAHAWLVADGRVLIGETDDEAYEPLLAWKSGPS